MASTSSFLTVALVAVLLGAANLCHSARRSLTDEPLPAVPDVPGMPTGLVGVLNMILDKFLFPVPDSNVLSPEVELELEPILKDLLQELQLQIAIAEEVLITHSEALMPEKELMSTVDGLMMPAAKDLVETLQDLIPFASSVPAPKDMMPMLVDLRQEMKLATPRIKDLIPFVNFMIPIVKRTMPFLVDQIEQGKLALEILKLPSSKVLIPEKELIPILRQALRSIKLQRAVSVVLRPQNKLMSDLLDRLTGKNTA